LQFRESLVLPVFISLPARLQRFQRFNSVFFCHLYQAFILAALGHLNFYLFASPPGIQPLLDNARFFHFGRQQDAVGDECRLRIELLDKLPQDYLVLFVFGALQNKIFAPNQFA
jgi:hypothetical protein